jgi:hypothetical protein
MQNSFRSRSAAPCCATLALLSAGAKHVWRDVDKSTVGIATSLNVSRSGSGSSGAIWTANVPVTFSLAPDGRTLLHANAGWMAGSAHGATAGVGLEQTLASSLTLLAETYFQHGHYRAFHAGLRFSHDAWPSIDMLAGHLDATSGSGWSLVIGINMTLSRRNLPP